VDARMERLGAPKIARTVDHWLKPNVQRRRRQLSGGKTPICTRKLPHIPVFAVLAHESLISSREASTPDLLVRRHRTPCPSPGVCVASTSGLVASQQLRLCNVA